jgi:hypothetical protein
MPTTQLAELPLTGGVDQHTDARKVPTAMLVRGENARIAKSGRYEKRYGLTPPLFNTSIPASPPGIGFTTPYTLGQRKDELLVACAPWLFAYSSAKGVGVYRDKLSEYTVKEHAIAQFNGSNWQADMAISSDGKLACYIWVGNYSIVGGSTTTIFATIEDVTTGTTLIGPVTLDSGANMDTPRALFVGTRFVLLWHDLAGHIRGSNLDTSVSVGSWAFSAPANLRSDLETSIGAFDACNNGANFTLVYMSTNAPPNDLSFVTFSSTFSVVTSSLNNGMGSSSTATAFSIILIGSNLWIAYTVGAADFKTFWITRVASTLAANTGPTLAGVETAAAFMVDIADCGTGNALVSWGQFLSGTPVTKRQVVSTGATVGPQHLDNLRLMQSRALLRGGKVVQLVATSQPNLVTGDVLEGTIELVEIPCALDTSSNQSTDRPLCTWSPRTAPDGGGRFGGHGSNLVVDVNGKLRTVAPRATITNAGQDGVLNPGDQRLIWWDLAFSTDQSARQSAELGGLTYFTGGVPSVYDGQYVSEASFIQYPHAKAATSGAAGGLTAGQQYQWAIVYKHTDAAGNVHRSSPFIVSLSAAAMAGKTTATLTISFLTLTTRQDVYQNKQSVVIEIYRTTAAGSTFFRLTAANDLASGVTASSTGTLRNNPASNTLTYTDGAADGVLSGQPTLPDQDGTLDSVCPPSCSLVCAHRGRVYYAGTPDGKTIWASQKALPFLAPGFNEGLTLYVDDGADISAIASLDDKLVVFKNDRIFIFTGDGPDPTGNNSDWSDPIRVTSPVGAISPYIVVTPLGLVFQSRVGLALLTRSLEVQPFWGARVEDELVTFPVVQYMLLHPTLPEIRIGVSDASGTSGLGEELRYDYRADAWLTARFSDDAVYGPMSMTALNFNGVPYIAFGSSGNLYLEDPTTWKDATIYAPTTLEFAPVGNGTQGYQAFRSAIFVGDRYTDHDLKVEFAYDEGAYGNPAPLSDTKTIVAATSAAFTAGYQFEISPPSANKCERFKVRLSDTFNAGTIGTGRGFSLSSIAFDVEPKNGPNRRLPAAQRF